MLSKNLLSVAMSSFLGVISIPAQTALTIYNDDFAVVRDEVPLTLVPGSQEASYSGVTSQLEPESVVLRDRNGVVPFRILEQSYRGDPINQERLLQLFEGETISFLQQFGDNVNLIEGKIVRAPTQSSSGYLEPIIEVDGELIMQLPGQPRFPSLGDESILQPTLTWMIYSAQEATIDAELSYLTRGLSWKSDYNLILPENGDEVAMTGWVSLSNRSGKVFKDTQVKLIAGNVNKLEKQDTSRVQQMAMLSRSSGLAEPEQVEERKFDEFHLYTLPGTINLRDQETKQVEFVRSDPVLTKKIYIYDGSSLNRSWRSMGVNPNPGYGQNSTDKVEIYREFKNSEDNNLGIALPAGIVRFYRTDIDGQIEFIGENQIDHTPKNETVRLYLGNAFDLVGERKITKFFKHPSLDFIRESFEIEIRNRSEEVVEVQVVENLYRSMNWEITVKSSDYEEIDARTVTFPLEIPAEETRTLTYTVEYTW